jgi:hypothetical protein
MNQMQAGAPFGEWIAWSRSWLSACRIPYERAGLAVRWRQRDNPGRIAFP